MQTVVVVVFVVCVVGVCASLLLQLLAVVTALRAAFIKIATPLCINENTTNKPSDIGAAVCRIA